MKIVAAGVALAAFASVVSAQPVIHAPGYELAREGTGARRDQLNQMELKPFDQTLWSRLTDWTNGSALNQDNTYGKVVLIYTWTNYLPNTLRPIASINRLVEQFGDKGLVVVGVHPHTGWSDAGKVLEQRRAEFVSAHDAENAFRDGLKVDQDPDFYLIDRAGQMRFADLDTGALSAAVELLVAETTEEAKGLVDRIKRDQATADREFGKTYDIRQDFALSDIPELPFAEPSAELYAQVQWPKVKEEDENSRSRYNQPTEPPRAPVYEDSMYYPSKPVFKGRVIVAYFFNPNIPQSYQKFMAEANTLQKAHGRDVVVLGVMTPKEDPNARSRSTDDSKVDPVKWAGEFIEFARTRDPKHWLVSDMAGQLSQALNSNQRGSNSESLVLSVQNAPYVAVISSDGVIRWHGNYHSSWFRFMLDETLRVDPAVQARRKVEEDYRRARGG